MTSEECVLRGEWDMSHSSWDMSHSGGSVERPDRAGASHETDGPPGRVPWGRAHSSRFKALWIVFRSHPRRSAARFLLPFVSSRAFKASAFETGPDPRSLGRRMIRISLDRKST